MSNERLADRTCRSASVGMYPDGRGLYLQCRQGASRIIKSWIFRYTADGKQVWMGLGRYPDVTLARARQKAQEARAARADGIDPLTAKRHQRASLRGQETKQRMPSFDECRDAYFQNHRAGWRSVRHSQIWMQSLKAHVTPVFGDVPVDMIDTALVCKALEPLWLTATETASRVRGRIEAVLNWAQTRGYRGTAPNPARWKGHLSNLFPARSKVAPVKHFKSMPYAEVPSFMAQLRQCDLVSSYAMQFLILTASRVGEVLGAHWDEIDFATRTWTIPADRTKSKREHRIPLSDSALEVLKHMQAARCNDFVFPGYARSTLWATTLLARLQRDGCRYTVHGFRSSFRDWCAERTSVRSEIAEMCLAHSVGNRVENAYRRTDLFERRGRLMSDWANYCDRRAAEVIALRA